MLNEESEKETEIFKKKIGADFKSFIKKSSSDYQENLKNELNTGFKAYYEELNKVVAGELLSQEAQQKELYDKIESYEKKIGIINSKIEKRNGYRDQIVIKNYEIKKKTQFFRFLFNYKTRMQNYKIKKGIVQKICNTKRKKIIFDLIKKISFHEKIQAYEKKIKERTENDIIRYEESLKKQKEEVLALILKAEEKLKHENRKKVQTKLQLDQIVLRGISALNMQAMLLSQNSLNGTSILF